MGVNESNCLNFAGRYLWSFDCCQLNAYRIFQILVLKELLDLIRIPEKNDDLR